jgi:hypothetical protein
MLAAQAQGAATSEITVCGGYCPEIKQRENQIELWLQYFHQTPHAIQSTSTSQVFIIY